jgi:serine/threonine protein kinase
MPLEIGKTISHYKIIGKLGEGGMGEVYLAADSKLKRQVAIKFLPSRVTINETDKARFLQEAQASAAINHPHVCVIHDIKEHEDQQFIIMEYVEGKTLRQLSMINDQFSISKAIDYAIQISEALQVAHEKGIIHRDIKSDNIMVTKTGQIKVMDFGLVKIKSSVKLSKTTSTAGTLAYMSPEQIEGKEIDARSDIFSFGVVLFELLAARRPFQEDYESALIYSILNEEPEPIRKLNSRVPVELERIINKTLAKNRSDRYQHMADILQDLRCLVEKKSSQILIHSVSDQKPQLAEKPIQSIVVLPLTNYSNDPEQEYFVDGMTETLITYLAKLHSLRIISRTSAMHYKSTSKSIPQIAQELNVDAVVEGSVLRDGDRVRITAQLIHAATDAHIWAETYDRDFEDILLLQSDVAQAITREIRIKLTQKEKKNLISTRSVNPDSYDAYLRGRFHWYKLSPQNVDKALEYFSLSLEKDPEYALAYTGIAMVWLVRVYWGTTPPREAVSKAKSLVLKAIEMDDTLEEAHDVLARVLYYFEWDWDGAEREFKRAIQLNPNKADVHLFYSSFLRSMGRGDEAMSEAQLGLELDPLNSFSQCYYIGQLLYLHQYDESIVQLRKIISLEPDFPFAHRYLWICYHQKQLYDEAIEEAKNYFTAVGKSEFSAIIDRGYSNSDYEGAMSFLAKTMEEHLKIAYIQPVWIARVYAHAGDKDRALDWLERAFEERDFLMTNLNTSSDWQLLHEEKRYTDLVNRLNFPKT